MYTGLTERFEYCSKCTIKKSDVRTDVYSMILDQAYERALSGLPAKKIVLNSDQYRELVSIVFKNDPPVADTDSIILTGPHGYITAFEVGPLQDVVDHALLPMWMRSDCE